MLTDFSLLEDWNDLLVLTGQVSYDHLLVIISARPGTLSYDSSFEKLPRQLSKYFSNNSLIVLYPNQSGEPLDTSFFSKLYTDTETRHYEKVGKWFYRWFKKDWYFIVFLLLNNDETTTFHERYFGNTLAFYNMNKHFSQKYVSSYIISSIYG